MFKNPFSFGKPKSKTGENKNWLKTFSKMVNLPPEGIVVYILTDQGEICRKLIFKKNPINAITQELDNSFPASRTLIIERGENPHINSESLVFTSYFTKEGKS